MTYKLWQDPRSSLWKWQCRECQRRGEWVSSNIRAKIYFRNHWGRLHGPRSASGAKGGGSETAPPPSMSGALQPPAHSDGPGSPQWDAECEEFGCHE